MSAIDEDREFDFPGTTVIEEFIKSGLHGAAGKEDVIDENDGGAVDIDGDLRRRKFLRDGMAADVVAVKGNVYRTGESVGKLGGKALSEDDATIGDAEKKQFFGARMAFGNGEREPVDGGVDFGSSKALRRRGHGGALCQPEGEVGKVFLGEVAR